MKNPSRKLVLRAALAVLLGAAAVAPAAAHHLWLLPSSTVLAKSQWITVDAAASDDLFYFTHVGVPLDDLAVTAPDGSRVTPDNPQRGRLRSSFDLRLEQPGSYRLALAGHNALASYTLKGEQKRWRGPVGKLAGEIPAEAENLEVIEQIVRVESFVTVGKPSALVPSGRGLELQPVTHPNDLVSGERASFRLLLDGKPAAGIALTLLPGNTRFRDDPEAVKLTTDATGLVSLTLPAPGLYYLDADAKDDRTSVPKAKERRLAYGATLEIQAK
ncbi:DUF4198 domain-containing protein [Derxia lacustris]|uniref:DUF4198 domain-containing protein n=1 Tax=Derxia lacustris TaxID=764842 RepID=UPI000A175151|nr:DUF4198 domain-containing protein [Derxia lacustris]